MSKRTKFLLGIGVIAALVIGWQVAAFAVHDEGVFELEGDVVDDPAGIPDDWENVFAGNSSADDTAFVPEPNPQSTFFTGGGSKDPQDIPAWKWKNDTGGLPDKSNITNSFAASYTATDGDQLLYFGADRFDGSGDAAIAFWFLQDEIALDPPPPPSGPANGVFSGGQHQEGDVLVISDFSNGGNVSTITVYEWTTDCGKAGDTVTRDLNDPPTPNDPSDDTTFTCGAANLLILKTSNAADCDTVAANDDACATVDKTDDDLSTVWPFDNKDSGTADNDFYLPGELFEGGINLTNLGLGGQCFATTVAETRTSTSPTSVLKDFTIGPFGDCAAGVTTQASKDPDNDPTTPPVSAGTVTPGTPVFDIASIQGSGTTPLIDPTGTVDFFLCGPGQLNAVDPDDPADPADPFGCVATNDPNDPDTAAGTDKPVSGGTNTTDGLSTAQSDNVNTAASPLAPGFYCFRAEYSGDTNYDPSSETNITTECFTVSQPTTTSTVQRWIPQDRATVTPANAAGTMTFTLYDNLTCTDDPNNPNDVLGTFTDSTKNAQGEYESGNTTPSITDTTVSWKASFDSSNFDDSVGVCETANVTFDNDGP